MGHVPLLLVLLLVEFATISTGAGSASTFPFHEEIRDPLSVVNRLYRERIEAGNTEGDWGVPAHFKKVLKKHWNKVPLLNAVRRVEDLQPGSLVRFRCMIQSVMNPEFFIGALTGKDPETGEDVPIACKFRDSIPPTVEEFPDTTDNVVARGMLERLPAMCIPVPGESAWVNQDSIACQELLPEPETPTKRRGAKRAQPDDAEQAAVKSQETDAEGAKQTGKEERKRGPHLRGVRSASTQAKQAEGGSSSSRKSRGNQAEDGKDREKGEHAALGEDFEVLQEADEKEGEAAQEEGGGAQEEEGGAQEKGGGAKGEEEEAEDVEGHVTGAESRTVEVGGSKIIFPSEDVANSVRAAQAHLRKVQLDDPIAASPKRERLPRDAEEREEGRRAPTWALGKDALWTVDDGLRVLAKFYDIDRGELQMMTVVEVAARLGDTAKSKTYNRIPGAGCTEVSVAWT